ncbi:serine/threonine-protein kinase ICK isoform X2 [Ascaphus truei]|uniref:serine/threonine-protein kinase ICK isoform X2 n=1 Tax=Ascaphus truei TaxID=8439 RepID=UPI003F5A4F59
MNRYTTIKQLGDGTYGSVLLGRSVESGELVAIKKMKRKFYSWDECMSLREVKSLKKLNHANVVKLKEVIRENDHLYFVFEYMKENLYQLMKDRNKLFPESTTRNIMYQILQGLAFIHKYGSSEIDTIFKICQILGTPKKTDWPEGYQLASAMSFRWPQCVPNNLKTLVPNASGDGIQIMRDMLQWDPKKRPTAVQALRYPCFHVGQALGTTQRVKELTKQQKELHEKQVPLLIKPVPPAHPPPKHQPRLSSRAFQQGQPNGQPFKMSASLADSANNPQTKDKVGQPTLPALITKAHQHKGTSNSESTNGDLNPKNRRRWGHITRALKGSDEWDDLDDLHLHSSVTRTEINEKRRPSDEALCSIESIVDLKPTDSGTTRPAHTSFSRQDNGASRRTSAAKQHYLKHSRYLPGLSIKNSPSHNPVNDSTNASYPWPNPNQPLKPLGLAGGTCSRLSGHTGGSGRVAGYIPSFFQKEMGSVGQKVHLAPIADPGSNYASLKSVGSYLGQPSFNPPLKSTPGLSPRPPPPIHTIHGRTDWISKYGGRR